MWSRFPRKIKIQHIMKKIQKILLIQWFPNFFCHGTLKLLTGIRGTPTKRGVWGAEPPEKARRRWNFCIGITCHLAYFYCTLDVIQNDYPKNKYFTQRNEVRYGRENHIKITFTRNKMWKNTYVGVLGELDARNIIVWCWVLMLDRSDASCDMY
jgi:hypothetical protein